MLSARRSLLAAIVAALAFAMPAAAAALPAGPRLTLLEYELTPGLLKDPQAAMHGPTLSHLIHLRSVDPDGGDGRLPFATPGVIPGGKTPLSWDADGGKVAFVGQPIEAVHLEHGTRVYLASGDGSGLHGVPGTGGTDTAVLSPDGRWIAFSKERSSHFELKPKDLKHESIKQINRLLEKLSHQYDSQTTWIVPVTDGKARRLTRWQNKRTSFPTSFSPEGSELAMTVTPPGGKEEVDVVRISTDGIRKIEADAGEAVFSPNDSQIAFVGYRDHEVGPGTFGPEPTSELYVAAADGSDPVRLTHTKRQQEGAPAWDPSGERIADLQSTGGFLGEAKVMETNPDGSCQRVLVAPRPRRPDASLLVRGPGWVWGEGRAAGRISC